jgi:hypothetical protein
VHRQGAEPSARRGLIMGQPVVHFEIIGNDPEKLRGYYGGLSRWRCVRSWTRADSRSGITAGRRVAEGEPFR